jgi:hypothetical protein
MTVPGFKNDILPIFAKYVADMKYISLDKTGTPVLLLDDYDSVRSFATEIQVAIHGYDYVRGSNPVALIQGARPLPKPGGKPGEYLTYVPHPMPDNPSNLPTEMVRLPQEAIDIFDAWVAAGMPA